MKKYKAKHESQFQDRIERHLKKLVKSYHDIMQLKGHENDNLLDWPVLEELKRVEKSEVYVDKVKLKEINEILLNPKIRRLLIMGAGGRGKTVLGRLLAYNKNNENWDVYFIDIRELAESEKKELVFEVDSIISNSDSTLFIFENSHISDEISDYLVKSVNHFVENYYKCHFLFLSRDFARDEDINPFKHWKIKKWFIEIKPNQALIESILKSYIKAHNIQYEISNNDKEWIQNNLMYKTNSSQNTVGGNLRLLRLYLTSWDFTTNKLFELKEQNILACLKKFYVIDELSGDAGLIEMLGKVVSIFQFDVPFYGKREYEPHTITLVEYLQRLNDIGTIKNIGQYYYTMSHSLDAYYLSKCLADFHKESHEDFTAFKIIDYLKELPSMPRDRTGENIFSLFKGALRRSREDFDNIRVFKIIYEEAKDLLLNTISINYRIGIITYLLQFINRTYDSETALSFWEEIKLKTNTQFWIDKIERSDALSVALLTMNLGKISQNECTLFFERYVETHFKKLYLSTNLILFQHFIRYLSLDKVDVIIEELSPESFKSQVLECSSLISIIFIIDKFTKSKGQGKEREKGLEFLKKVFMEIELNHFNNFKTFLLKQNGFATIQRLREALNQISPTLRTKIDTDKELAKHLQELRSQSIKKLPIGTAIIKKKMAKGLLHLRSKKEFIKVLNLNFNDFELEFNSLNTISRLIYKTTQDDERYKSLGLNVINKIIYQLSDEILTEACNDLRFLDMIEKIDNNLYEHIPLCL